ncbi:VOC family protein [Actinoplanes palleronii]|uniref:VOC family protein n=1 Tax=Actinoplanes palleronii TaxID=113570 RepID=A0ABQ4BFU2_9ACTN|nr:VOC family protein [Actinoplanes palleronii]GIE69465.1 VOC family protein [Actinoplanes palleronii]
MTARTSPYLSFGGNAREAMEFYRSVFGGNLRIVANADMGTSPDDLVAHATLIGPTGVVLFGADTAVPAPGAEVALGGDATELGEYWERLAAGGTVTTPFGRSPWGALFGRCVDRYGVAWLVNATG